MMQGCRKSDTGLSVTLFDYRDGKVFKNVPVWFLRMASSRDFTAG